MRPESPRTNPLRHWDWRIRSWVHFPSLHQSHMLLAGERILFLEDGLIGLRPSRRDTSKLLPSSISRDLPYIIRDATSQDDDQRDASAGEPGATLSVATRHPKRPHSDTLESGAPEASASASKRRKSTLPCDAITSAPSSGVDRKGKGRAAPPPPGAEIIEISDDDDAVSVSEDESRIYDAGYESDWE